MFYVWSGLFAFIANIAIALFVYTRNPEEKKNFWFGLFSCFVASWCVGSFTANILPDKAAALWALRLHYLFGVWVPALYVQFVYAFDEGIADRHVSIKLKSFYGCSLLLSLFVFTPFFIPFLRVISGHAFYISSPGPFYYVFFAYFSLAMAEVLYQIVKGLRTKIGLELRQFQYLALANVLAILAGFEYFLRVFGYFSQPPLDDYILILDVAILAYGVTRHRLFDVDALIRAFRKERLATLGLLTSSINHEIKNPLYVIKGSLENYLEGGKVLRDQDEIKAFLQKLHAQTTRICDLLSRYHQLLKDNSRKMSETKKASMQEAVDYTLQMLQLLEPTKQVQVSSRIDGALPSILITQGELEEILMNLLANAYQAVPKGGKIMIAAQQAGGRVQIKVEDHGAGFSAKQLRNAFHPFHSTKGEQGLGLGLYITKEIIERNGGKIAVTSKPGEGTTFTLTFPAVSHSAV